LDQLARLFSRKRATRAATLWHRAILTSAIIGMLLPTFRHRSDTDQTLREAGLGLRSQIRPGASLAVSDERLAWYADGRMVFIEWWFGHAEALARAGACEYLVLTSRDLRKRLEPRYLDLARGSPAFEFVRKYPPPSPDHEGVWVFRVRPTSR
jgi:hypothetical protein